MNIKHNMNTRARTIMPKLNTLRRKGFTQIGQEEGICIFTRYQFTTLFPQVFFTPAIAFFLHQGYVATGGCLPTVPALAGSVQVLRCAFAQFIAEDLQHFVYQLRLKKPKLGTCLDNWLHDGFFDGQGGAQ